MNECEHAQLVSAYHDGELASALRAEFEEHLGQCASCAAELAYLRELSRLLGRLAEPKISSHALHRLHRGADDASEVGIWRMARMVSAVAAAILLVCSVWVWLLSTATAEAGGLSPWERSALQQEEFPAAENGGEQLTMWMIEGLTGNNDHD